MKLVDILARELMVWPNDEYESIGQSCTGTLHKSPNWLFECGWTKEAYTMADDWSRVHVTRAQWQAAVDALKAEVSPTESMALHHQEVGRITRQWNGEGLPPVGIDVEVFAGYSHPRFDRFIGQQVHIVAHDVINGDPVAVFRMPVDGDDTEQDYHAMVAGSFRPIRTPEQIAADEQEKGILQMAHDCGHWWQSETDTKCLPPIFSAMWKAGYRKFEIVDN